MNYVLRKMKVNIVVGGKAGQGPNIVTHILAESLIDYGWHVFYSREYESLIRGGHNFNTLTFSDSPVYSNESKIDILVCLDEATEKKHKTKGLILKGKTENMYYLGALFKVLGMDFKLLEEKLKKLKNFEENLRNAKDGFEKEKTRWNIYKKVKEFSFMNGSQGIAEGSIKAGLDFYFAYPMTPATPILFELAGKKPTIELENEIAVITAALGASITGAKTMVGTSGGGFDLMTESLSMAGMAEIPVVTYLASRPGPSTGVATGTGQGDLNLALYSGHGEFFRLVVAHGNPDECQELVSQAFYFSQKYKIPAIVLSDKHLAESFYSSEETPEIQESKKTTELIRYNSYEHTQSGEATEKAEQVKKNVERRLKKIGKEKFVMHKIYGNKNAKNLVVSYGSTKGAIIDALPDNFKFLQILYLSPFPDIKKELEKAEKIILVENSATGMLGDLIRKETGVEIKNKILRYDGKPFLSDELRGELK